MTLQRTLRTIADVQHPVTCDNSVLKVVRVANNNSLKLPREFALLVKQARRSRVLAPYVRDGVIDSKTREAQMLFNEEVVHRRVRPYTSTGTPSCWHRPSPRTLLQQGAGLCGTPRFESQEMLKRP